MPVFRVTILSLLPVHFGHRRTLQYTRPAGSHVPRSQRKFWQTDGFHLLLRFSILTISVPSCRTQRLTARLGGPVRVVPLFALAPLPSAVTTRDLLPRIVFDVSQLLRSLAVLVVLDPLAELATFGLRIGEVVRRLWKSSA